MTKILKVTTNFLDSDKVKVNLYLEDAGQVRLESSTFDKGEQLQVKLDQWMSKFIDLKQRPNT